MSETLFSEFVTAGDQTLLVLFFSWEDRNNVIFGV